MNNNFLKGPQLNLMLRSYLWKYIVFEFKKLDNAIFTKPNPMLVTQRFVEDKDIVK